MLCLYYFFESLIKTLDFTSRVIFILACYTLERNLRLNKAFSYGFTYLSLFFSLFHIQKPIITVNINRKAGISQIQNRLFTSWPSVSDSDILLPILLIQLAQLKGKANESNTH